MRRGATQRPESGAEQQDHQRVPETHHVDHAPGERGWLGVERIRAPAALRNQGYLRSQIAVIEWRRSRRPATLDVTGTAEGGENHG